MRPKRCTMCPNRAEAGSFTCSDDCREARKWKQRSLDRHRDRSKVPGTFRVTVEDWMDILRSFNNCCAYCGREGKMTIDHVLPLSRGGRHCIANLVPACNNCNHKKGSLTVSEWRNWPKSKARSFRQRQGAKNARTWGTESELGIGRHRNFKPKEAPIFDQMITEYRALAVQEVTKNALDKMREV